MKLDRNRQNSSIAHGNPVKPSKSASNPVKLGKGAWNPVKLGKNEKKTRKKTRYKQIKPSETR